MSDMRIFAKEMAALGATIQSNVVKLQKEVAEHVVEFVATSTPIDTGQASGNWITNVGAPSTSMNIGPSSPGVSIGQVKTALMALRMGQDVHITNNLPYIVKLNQGYSQQAPASFVELSAVSALGLIGRFNLLVK